MGLFAGAGSLQQLVDEHYRPLYCYAYRLTGNAAEAEDVTQETYCKAQANLSQLRDPTRAKAWLFSILRNVYLHKLRINKSHPCLSLEDVGEVAERPLESQPINSEHLQEALNELPEVFRTPIILYYFEDFSYGAIAEHMEVPIGTVMSRLARAKAHLRARLGRLEPAEVFATGRASDGL
jgi:RNA polymerase sigma-70 factor (ECF subfamily)